MLTKNELLELYREIIKEVAKDQYAIPLSIPIFLEVLIDIRDILKSGLSKEEIKYFKSLDDL